MADDTARRNRGRAGIMAASIAALVFLATGLASAATVTVVSVNFRFQPESQTVNVGDVVQWTFAGEPHTVTSGAPGALDGRFDSGIKDPGASFLVTFETAGTFPYFCQIHAEQMFGTIVVQAAASSTPTADPTATPTAGPTVKPTASPTARPTVKPTASPTARPTPSPEPSVQTTASAPAASGPSTPSTIPSPGPALSGSPPASVETSATPTLDGSAPPSSPDAAWIVAGMIVVGLLVAGGVAIARRPRGG